MSQSIHGYVIFLSTHSPESGTFFFTSWRHCFDDLCFFQDLRQMNWPVLWLKPPAATCWSCSSVWQLWSLVVLFPWCWGSGSRGGMGFHRSLAWAAESPLSWTSIGVDSWPPFSDWAESEALSSAWSADWASSWDCSGVTRCVWDGVWSASVSVSVWPPVCWSPSRHT